MQWYLSCTASVVHPHSGGQSLFVTKCTELALHLQHWGMLQDCKLPVSTWVQQLALPQQAAMLWKKTQGQNTVVPAMTIVFGSGHSAISDY